MKANFELKTQEKPKWSVAKRDALKWFLCSIETYLYQHPKRLEHFFFITTRRWMQNFNLMTMTPYILFVGMLAARLTSASSFLVAKDSLVSLTDKI